MSRRPRLERGTATIEMVYVLLTSILVLGFIVLVGRLTWHATALVKGVADTTRIVATLPRTTLVGDDTAQTFARQSVPAATRSAGLDLQPRAGVLALCGGGSCSNSAFTHVTVEATIPFYDTIFGSDLFDITADYNIPAEFDIKFTYRQSYVQPTVPPAN